MIKTHYDTEEDIFFLQQILMRAVMTTDTAFEPVMNDPQLAEYRKIVFATRAKIFEYLGMPDPNEAVIKHIQKNNDVQNNESKIITKEPNTPPLN